jgi:hypothetical protein
MSDSSSKDLPTIGEPARAPGARGLSSARRRALLRAGVVGAPTVMALASSPAMATTSCKLPSGFSVSGNLSRTGGKNCTSLPCSKPSVWNNSTNCPGSAYQYKTTGVYKAHTFNGVLCGSSRFGYNGTYPNSTWGTCLGTGSRDTHVQALACAVYLHAKANGGAGFPTQLTVMKMWNDAVITGVGYVPSAGAKAWNSTDVKNYFLYLTNQAV